jgi:hypothetical protein
MSLICTPGKTPPCEQSKPYGYSYCLTSLVFLHLSCKIFQNLQMFQKTARWRRPRMCGTATGRCCRWCWPSSSLPSPSPASPFSTCSCATAAAAAATKMTKRGVRGSPIRRAICPPSALSYGTFFELLFVLRVCLTHRFNMELDLQSLFGLHVHSCTHWLRPRYAPLPPAFGLIYEGAIGQPR